MVSQCMSQASRRLQTTRSNELEPGLANDSSRARRRVGSRVLMTRVFAFFVACAALSAPSALALGLGEIDTRSALNERFIAEIELLDTRGLDASEVIASLASAEDFERVGVERFFFLTDLKFEVVPNARGRLVILASSSKPVSEPYLNFLVEVLWPSGRLLKEYTVLLDPPTFTGTTAAPVTAPTRTQSASAPTPAAPAASPSRLNSASGRIAVPNRGAQTSRVKPQNFDSGTITTDTSDTMWSIGNRTLPSNEVSVQQNMLAIQRENPEAFINDNINLLKAGQVLKLPSTDEIKALSEGEAVAELQRQNEDWRAGTQQPRQPREAVADATDATGEKLQAQIDATDSAPETTEAIEESDAAGVLQIVAADTDSAGIAETTGAGAEEGTALTSAERDRLAALSRQVDELTYQLDQKRAEADQLAESEKQINLKDAQIAQLQQALKEAQSQPAEPQNQSAQSTPSDSAAWWQKPWLIISGLGALAFLLAAYMFRRRSPEEFEFQEEAATEPSFELGAPEVDRSMSTQVLLDEDLDLAEVGNANLTEELASALDDSTPTATMSAVDSDADDDLFGADPDAAAGTGGAMDSQQTDDVISEADIYIAYGRYPQAIALLLGSIEDDPSQHDVRLRLAEVYAETKDADGFTEQADYLTQNCNDANIRGTIAELRSTMGIEQSSDDASGENGSATETIAGGAAVSADAAGEEDVLDLDDTPLDFEIGDAADSELELSEHDSSDANDVVDFELSSMDGVDAAETDTEVEVDAQVDTDTVGSAVDDFELELDLDTADEASDKVAEHDDLGGDLGIDFSTDSTDTTEMLAATSGADDDQLLDEIERSLDELEGDGADISTDLDDDSDFSFSDDSDTSATKLDLARAYIDMGDDDGAREILGEVIAEGDTTQKTEANDLLGKL